MLFLLYFRESLYKRNVLVEVRSSLMCHKGVRWRQINRKHCIAIFLLAFDKSMGDIFIFKVWSSCEYTHITSKAADKPVITLFKSNSAFKFSKENGFKLPQFFFFFFFFLPYAFTHHWTTTAKEILGKLKFKRENWLQLDSNPQPLSLWTNAQSFS